MPAVLIVVLIAAVVLAAIVLYAVRQHAAAHNRVDAELHDERVPTLEYAVPTGQDPVVILAALEQAGYVATVDPQGAHQHVLVKCPRGIEAERESVRSAIESASVTTPIDGMPLAVDVRFLDEV